jgi:2-keto-3-deoxy-L-rhamnonate aldolase RhmA
MAALTVHPATAERVAHVLDHLRDADRREVALSSGKDVREVLLESVALSDWANVAEVDGVPAILYGVAYIAPGIGAPWMVATDDIRKVRRQFVQACRAEVDVMAAAYPDLRNIVARFNRCSIRWLEWLGFTIHRSRGVGPGGKFYLFTKGAPSV